MSFLAAVLFMPVMCAKPKTHKPVCNGSIPEEELMMKPTA